MSYNIFWLVNRLGVIPLLSIWKWCDRRYGKYSDKSTVFLVLSNVFFAVLPIIFLQESVISHILVFVASVGYGINWTIFIVNFENNAEFEIKICDIYFRCLLKKLIRKKKVRFNVTDEGNFYFISLKGTKLENKRMISFKRMRKYENKNGR